MSPSTRTLVRRARRQVLRPPRFLARAVRAGGPEREAVVQAAKAAVAAVLAWLIARWVLRTPQPFLAPYVAVFLVVQVTVYRSVRDAAQQLAVVASGSYWPWWCRCSPPRWRSGSASSSWSACYWDGCGCSVSTGSGSRSRR